MLCFLFNTDIFNHKNSVLHHYSFYTELLTEKEKMAENYKVSCEINLSRNIGNYKGRNYTEEKVVVDMKLFTCENCSKSFNHKCSMQRHLKEVHYGKKRDVKHHEKIINNEIETVKDGNKYIESVLNRVKTDFERKRELGKIAIEMIDKYDLIVQGIPQEVKNAIKFHEKIEKMDGRG